MLQLPVRVGRADADVREVRAGAQAAELHRLIVKIIRRDALAQPQPRAMSGAGGDDARLGS